VIFSLSSPFIRLLVWKFLRANVYVSALCLHTCLAPGQERRDLESGQNNVWL